MWVFSVLLVIPNSVAVSDSGTSTINEDEYLQLGFELDETGTLEYTIEVIDGPYVDVLLFDDDNYADFRAGSGSKYIADGSDLNTLYAENDVDLNPDDYHLVIDNTDYGSAHPPWDMANNQVKVRYSYTLSTTGDMLFAMGCIAGIVIIIIVVVIVFYSSKKKKQSNPQLNQYSQPQYGQPYGYQQPQSQAPPPPSSQPSPPPPLPPPPPQ